MKNTPLQRFRIIAIMEGISFVVLLFIAMPLKYLADMPLAVRVVGMIHGILFILFVAMLADVSKTYKWPLRQSMMAFIASILPFGTLVYDARILKQQEDELQ